MNILEASGLKVYYQTVKGVVKAVDGVDMVVEEGTSVGLAGESGCGKTTLGLSFLKLLPPNGVIESGSLLFDGDDIYKMDEKRFREDIRWKHISMIFQGAMNALNPVFTVEDQIGEAIKLHDRKSKKKERTQAARDLLKKVDIDPVMGSHYPHEFSGGQRQRIGVARALACDPDLIVCDEPISALDVSIQAQIINLLEELQANSSDLSYLFIAHDLSVVRHISDRIAVMYLGHIVEICKSRVLYENPLHPYTRALLSAVPIADPFVEETRERIILKGEVPSPLNPPSGCPFHPRCFMAIPECSQTLPPLRVISNGHEVACLRV